MNETNRRRPFPSLIDPPNWARLALSGSILGCVLYLAIPSLHHGKPWFIDLVISMFGYTVYMLISSGIRWHTQKRGWTRSWSDGLAITVSFPILMLTFFGLSVSAIQLAIVRPAAMILGL